VMSVVLQSRTTFQASRISTTGAHHRDVDPPPRGLLHEATVRRVVASAP
jgi:hypothetical protein